MIFKNKKIFMILFFMIILLFIYIAYLENRIEYKLFLGIAVIVSLIFYLFAVFEYFEIDENKIVYVNPLRSIKKEARWNEIRRIYVYPTGIFKAVRIGYGTLDAKEIVINTGVKDYKRLIKIVLNKVDGNDNISIDRRVDEFIE